MIAQAIVIACESKVTPIGDMGAAGGLLPGSLVNGGDAPYKQLTQLINRL
jgi:hypothetical protein